MRSAGQEVATPDELESGGVDFAMNEEVANLKERLRRLTQTRKVILHLAPPCATFSRARDRSSKTRLRSAKHPEGLKGVASKVDDANNIAFNAWDLAVWAAELLQAIVTLENPKTSYIWKFLEKERNISPDIFDLPVSPCCYGASYQKHTRVSCWNWQPVKLSKTCSLEGETFTCGQSKSNGHEVLEFGGRSAKDAAAYDPGLCKAWALEMTNFVVADTTTATILKDTTLTSQGRVRRHVSRGADEQGKKERRDAEDKESQAGMRNPADLEKAWPTLWSAMDKVRSR